ncbi:MAG: hypothetical protein WBB28_22795 [Crinalium sp.]
MILPRFHKILAPLLLSMLLLVTSCATQAPSRWDQAQRESTQKAPITRTQDRASAGKAVTGGQFNKFFPSAGGGYQRVYTQEKQGFAEAKLKRGGTDVAVLSINDTASSPSAKLKFKQSSQTIAGYPAVSQGQNITSILVGDRYQVKVQSRDASFTQGDREAWLKKFNLGGLSRLR